MSKTERVFFKDSEGSTKLPGNGTYETGNMSADYDYSVIYVATYDVNGNLVDATAGTATASIQDINGQWDSGVSDGDNPIDLTQCGESAGYAKPLFLGDCKNAKLAISGLTGADHVKAFVKRG